MKSVYSYLTERVSQTKHSSYDQEATDKLSGFLGRFPKTISVSDINKVKELIAEGAEISNDVVEYSLWLNWESFQKIFIDIFLKTKTKEEILNDWYTKDVVWTLPQAIFGAKDWDIRVFEYLVKNHYYKDINEKNKHGSTVMHFVITNNTRETNKIKKAIDILLECGADINDTQWSLSFVSKKVIREYLIAKGRTED